MAKKNSVTSRLDPSLDEILSKIAKDNDLSKPKASKFLAKMIKVNLQESKLKKEIKW